MKMPNILHQIQIDTSPEKTYEALTTEKGLASWWTEEVKAKPEVGTLSEFRFEGGSGFDLEVTELIPNKQVKWLCRKGSDDWMNTQFSFDLEEVNGKTKLRFAHKGWKTENDHLSCCNSRWAVYLFSLKEYLEKGKGNPWPNDLKI